MKKNTLLGLLGIFLCSATAPQAADYCQNWNNNNCCEWSMCDGRFNVGADWLYWKTEQDFMTVGTIVEGNINGSERDPLIFHAHNKCPNYKYDNGFRVWAGYQLPCDCWEVGVAYTYLPASANIVSFHQQEPQKGDTTTEFFSTYLSDFALIRNFDGLGDGNVFTDFHAKWNSNLNYIDLDIARSICLCECFKFRPHIGFRAAWQDQKLRATGVFPITGDEIEAEGNVVVTNTLLKQKFRGYGIEGGLWGDWSLGCGLSVVGHVGGSVLYSKFTLTQEQERIRYFGSGEGDLNVAVDLHDSCWTGIPTVDYFLGLQYEDCFCDMIFSVHAGWEQHVFFDMNRLSSKGGNLSMQGLTLGVNVGF